MLMFFSIQNDMENNGKHLPRTFIEIFVDQFQATARVIAGVVYSKVGGALSNGCANTCGLRLQKH